jgi:hypothetical protein
VDARSDARRYYLPYPQGVLLTESGVHRACRIIRASAVFIWSTGLSPIPSKLIKGVKREGPIPDWILRSLPRQTETDAARCAVLSRPLDLLLSDHRVSLAFLEACQTAVEKMCLQIRRPRAVYTVIEPGSFPAEGQVTQGPDHLRAPAQAWSAEADRPQGSSC